MMALRDDPTSACVQQPFGADFREFYVPPTTHLVAAVKDLTNMLDYTSENAEYMDEDSGATANTDAAPPSPAAR
jgi:hypothetical protein